MVTKPAPIGRDASLQPNRLTSLIDKNWYNEFYSEQQNESLAVRPEIVRRYSELRHPRLFLLERWFEILDKVKGKKILYLACGHDSSGVLLAMKGAEVWVSDIAFEAVRVQVRMAAASGVADRVQPVVGSCEQLPFPGHSFDMVVGAGIWHHLQSDLQTPCSEVARLLAPNGFGVFSEPIAQSPLLEKLRKRVPVAAPISVSPVCRPLSTDSLDFLRQHFRLEADFFQCFGRVTRLILRGSPLENASPIQRFTIYLVHHLDRFLFSLPSTERFAGAVVLKISAKREATSAVRAA